MKLAESERMYKRSCQSLAGGVSSNVRAASKPFPLFYQRGVGSRIYDVDGNEYIDYVLGQGPLILGHSHPYVLEAVKKQLERGQIYAGQHELEILLSEKLQKLIPCAELVRYSNSGSEAVHAAIRLARAYTGKRKVVKFEGHYHGWFDDMLVSVSPKLSEIGPRESPSPILESKGQLPSVLEEVIVLPWNDPEIFRRTLQTRSEEIAAVIMEPIMCNTGCILPGEGYLAEVRRSCAENKVILIFDEVITGFRFCLGGAQSYFNVTPDLAVFGKAMAGGFPLSCLAGRKELMGMIADLSVVHAGTFNSNPVCMAAALATIEKLEENDGAAYRQMFRLGEMLMDGIRELAHRKGMPILVQGLGPMFHVALTERRSIRDYRDYTQVDGKTYIELATKLQEVGIRVLQRGIWYLCAAHSSEDIEITLEKLNEVLT